MLSFVLFPKPVAPGHVLGSVLFMVALVLKSRLKGGLGVVDKKKLSRDTMAPSEATATSSDLGAERQHSSHHSTEILERMTSQIV